MKNKQYLISIIMLLMATFSSCKKEECYYCKAMKGYHNYYVKNQDTIVQTFLGLSQPPSSDLLGDGYTVTYVEFTLPIQVEYCKPEVDKHEYYTNCEQTK